MQRSCGRARADGFFFLNAGDAYGMHVSTATFSGVASYAPPKATGAISGELTGSLKFTPALTNAASAGPVKYTFAGTLGGLTGSTSQNGGTITGATITGNGTLPAGTTCTTFEAGELLAAKLTAK